MKLDLNKLHQRFPGVTISAAIPATTPVRDSIDDARQKVIENALANKEYFKDTTSAVRPGCRIYAEKYGSYYVGLKYGNRWLKNISPTGSFFKGVDSSEVPDFIDYLIDETKNGVFDEPIEAIMNSNLQARVSRAH